MSGFFYVDLVLFAILTVTAITIAQLRHLYAAAMLSGLFSLVCASIFVLLDAVDVAFTEAAVGAGITTVLFLSALALTNARERFTPRRLGLPALIVVTITGATLIYASQDLPVVGSLDSPVQTHPLKSVYLEESVQETGIPNVVTTVLASYRGYDTMGEVAVIFTAGIGVLLLLARTRKPRSEAGRS